MIDFLDVHWFVTLAGAVVALFAVDAVATRRGWYGHRKCRRCARPTHTTHCRRCLEII